MAPIMSELFDTSQVRDDAEHWDTVAERVMAAVAQGRPALIEWLASPRIIALAACSIVVALSMLVLRREGQPAGPTAQELAALLGPADPAGKIMTVADRPPEIERLVDSRLRSDR